MSFVVRMLRHRSWLGLVVALVAMAGLGMAGLGCERVIAAPADLGLRPLLDRPGDPLPAPDPRPGWSDDIAIGPLGLVLGAGLCALRARRRERRLRVALAASRARYDHLAEQTSDVVLRIGRHETSVSSSIDRLLGYTAAAMRDIPMAELVHPEDLERVVAAFHSLDGATRRVDLDYRLVHESGATVWVEATFGRLERGAGESETIVTIRDITRRHEEAEALRVAIQAARDARNLADEANRAKSDFLASMSHEVRTPPKAIIGFADLLLGAADVPDVARRHAERIKGGGDALLTIVDDILDFSQAETGALKLDPRPFALPLLVDECVALVERAAVAKHLALLVELADRFPTGLMGDEGRLRQILLNLLNNAIKFTREGGVTARIGYTAGADRILFEITDTGIGIAPEDLPRLFQRFRQVDGTIRRTYGGTGLGLAISKMLVDLMGGSIGVRSTKGAGSTFWFELALPPAPLVLATEAAPPAKPAPRGLDILLAEDVPINQKLERAVLEANGHPVDMVGDGADAIMAVADRAYDLVLMDVQMPFVDGFTATRAIRALPGRGGCVPIVALTANVLQEHVAAAHAAGMDDFLPKPLAIDALLAVLERAARGRVLDSPARFG